MTHDTRKQLGEIPELFALLPLFTIPGTGGDDTGRSAGSPARAPLSLDVLDLTDTRTKPDTALFRDESFERDKIMGARRQGILPTLASWTRLVDSELWDEDREHTAPDDNPTVVSECRFLLEHLDWIEDQQWRNELEADVNGMHRDLRRALREPDEIPLVCLVPGCGWNVEVMDNGTWFRCTGCGQDWSEREVRRLYEAQQPMSLAQCAVVVSRPIKTLHHWRAKGWIKPAARDGRGALYRLTDIQKAALGIANGQRTESA